MPIITFVSPKGGVGKTTAALVLATQLARSAKVTVIDADPNRPFRDWVREPAAKEPAGNISQRGNITVISDASEDNLMEQIEAASSVTPFVIVDLEGTAAKIVLLAASMSDLVIIPTQGSHLDAMQAAKAVKAVTDTEKMTRREIPFQVLMTRTNPVVRSRSTSFTVSGLVNRSVPMFKIELNEREAFRGMFAYRTLLHDLTRKEFPTIDKAIANAEAFANEVVGLLRKKRIKGESTKEKTA